MGTSNTDLSNEVVVLVRCHHISLCTWDHDNCITWTPWELGLTNHLMIMLTFLHRQQEIIGGRKILCRSLLVALTKV